MTKIEKEKYTNKTIKYTSLFFSLLIIAIFAILILFILFFAVKGFQEFGISKILFNLSFNASKDEFSFWIPFSITIITSTIALCLAVPIGIKVAIFTKYRLKKRFQKYILILFQTLSGIPSVIFGLFAAQSLGLIWLKLFNINPNSIFNGAIMLVFMVIPTIVSMTLDSLNNVDNTLIENPQALGNTKTRAIYKVAKKAARNGIIVAIIIALSRAIGESMAVSMILQAQPNSEIYSNGFFNFLNSSSQSLGAYISTAMFADNDPEKMRPLLYAFGLIMLIFSMILNFIIIGLSRKKGTKNNSKIYKLEQKISEYILWIPTKIKLLFEKISFKSNYQYDKNNIYNVTLYMRDRTQNYKFKWIYPSWKIFWEIISIILCFAFVFWIVGDILINGIIGIYDNPKNFFVYSKNSVSQSLVNTLIIVMAVLAIGFPISLMCAIYLNEYSKNGKIKKSIVFFLDSLGTTPSIIFGMFGLILFIQTFGWTSNGKLGNSLIAGALTLVIVIIPSFTRLLEQSLKNIPDEIRNNSYALGNTKWQTIRKLIIPMALISITTSIISIIGRILSETAPLYLTAGLSSSSVSVLDRPGTTLTTHIYAQIFSPNANSTQIQYQAALLTLIFVLTLIIIGYIVIPNRKKIKESFKDIIYRIKGYFINDEKK